MKSQPRSLMFIVTILTVLALSAFWVLPASADDEVPPPAPTSEVVEPPEQIPPVEIPAAPEEVPAATEPSMAESLAQIPEGTEVVVTGDKGENVPLASQKAADAIAVADPMWCPTGVAPGGAGCSINYGSLELLVADVGTGLNPAANGVIWISTVLPDASVSPIVINGGLIGGFSVWHNFSLTLKGGWTEVGSTINTSDPSEINISLSIINWNADITLSDIIFTGVSVGSTANSAALNIQTTKKITITNLDVIQNTGAGTVNGAWLDNNDGGTVSDVVITNSTFADNKNDGLNVYSDGMISISNLIANGNGGVGAILDNDSALTAKAVTLTGNSNQAKFNGSDGLVVYSNGAITISGITANNNGGWGTYLDNDGFLNGLANVTLTGTNNFKENFLSGLEIYSDGLVAVSNIFATNNGTSGTYGYGLYVDNHGASTPKAVTISVNGANPDSDFANNYSGGLAIHSLGAISLSGVLANGSLNGNGATLKNDYLGAVGGITIGGWGGSFSDNLGGYGLNASSFGAITATGLWAWGNSSYGATLDNSTGKAPVTISGDTGYGFNGSDGLVIRSKGAITLKTIYTDTNNGVGVTLDNTYSGPASPQKVTLTGNYHDFNFNTGTGLLVSSFGIITINNIHAEGNGGRGAVLTNTGPGTGQNVIVTGHADFVNNTLNGLELYTKGIVTLNNVYASGNHGSGALIHNETADSPKAVTLTGFNGFNDNYSDGLHIYSKGAITVSNLSVNNNGLNPAVSFGYGAFLNNTSSGAGAPQNVTVSGNNQFNGNFYSGLTVFSYGAIMVSNVTANNNGGDNGSDPPFGWGLYLDNHFGTIVKAVTLSGYADFQNNYSGGLGIASHGIVILNSLNAINNGGDGVFVDNFTGSTLGQAVSINADINTTDNAGYGLFVHSLGIIKVNNLNSVSNGYGAFLDNNDGSTPAAVTITGGAFTYSSDNYGMQITSKGAINITVTDAWIGDNGTYGWNLDNSFAGSVGGINLTSPNSDWAFDFGNNGSYGLWVQSLGSIKVTGLDAYDNGGVGATLNNALPGSIGTVTVTVTGRNDFSSNGANGLTILSNRAITINNLYAWSNSGAGVSLNNSSSGIGSPQNVTLTGSGEFYTNGDTGLVVDTYGLITLSNISANDNGQNHGAFGWGAWLDNCGYDTGSCDAVTPKAIILNGINNFNGNYQSGLWATSLGVIKVNAITANGNTVDGAYLNNEWAGAVGGITITSASAISLNNFNGNGSVGLNAYSGRLVSLSNIFANGNVGGGAHIETYSDFGPANVILSGRNTFNGNGDFGGGTGSGLEVYATGTITVNNLTASGNAFDGAILDNWYAAFYYGPVPPFTINLTGVNTFSGNGNDGLFFTTYGNVGLNHITADNNVNNGVWGETHGLVPGNIVVSCGSMNNNGAFGWHLSTLGIVTLKGVYGFGNISGNFNTAPQVIIRTCP